MNLHISKLMKIKFVKYILLILCKFFIFNQIRNIKKCFKSLKYINNITHRYRSIFKKKFKICLIFLNKNDVF